MESVAEGDSAGEFRVPAAYTNGRRFEEIGRRSGSGFAGDAVGRSLIAGDVDNDGDVDLLITNNGAAPDLLRNDGGNRGNAIEVRAVGVRVNRSGIGARVTVVAGGRTQVREVKSGSSYLGQSDLRAHVGIGASPRVDSVDVRWPGGRVDHVVAPPVNNVITVEEGKGMTKQTPFVRSP